MPVIDIDTHVYEPPEIWERYVPAEARSQAKSAFYHEVDALGNRVTVLNGAPAKEMNRRKLIRQALWRPGRSVEEIGQLDPDRFEPLNCGAWDPAAKVADMDAMGVDRALVFPTLFAEYLPQVVDPVAADALARGYNDWIWDFAAATGGRVLPVAVLPLQSVLFARRELDRLAAKGFTAVTLRPAFYKLDVGASQLFKGDMAEALAALQGGAHFDKARPVFIEDRPFRALWERIDELGLVACVHPSLGITGPDAVSAGGFAERVSARIGVAHTVAEPIAYMQDADLFVTAALFHGLLEDLPGLKLAIAHCGTSWVPLALEKSETYLWLTAYGMSGPPVCLEPREVWDRHPLIVGFDSWERSVGVMPDVLGTKAAWGSRYPFHDTATPAEARQMLDATNVDAATAEQLLGGHAAQLFGLHFPAAA